MDVQRNVDPLKYPLFYEKYHLLEKIGEGGMGAVYRGIDVQNCRSVAIKTVLLPRQRTDQTIEKRMVREYHFLRAIHHPHLVEVIDLVEEKDTFFLVMELVQGLSLLDSAFQVLPLQLIIANQIARAVEALNTAGILHRDVKPGNILVSAEDKRAVLLDLGLAKSLSEGTNLTATNVIVGTPEYLSPEQTINQITPRSDVFSLGVTLYQFFLGLEHSPFAANDIVTTMLNVANQPLPLLIEQVQRDISGPQKRAYLRLSALLQKATEKYPHLRLENAGILADELGRIHEELMKEEGKKERESLWVPFPPLDAEKRSYLLELGRQYGRDVEAGLPEEKRNEGVQNISFVLDNQKVDHYDILEKLGSGGMGVVYKAKDTNLKRFVALKVICKGVGKSLKRFFREIEISARLSHPNIVKVFHMGEFNQIPYLAMEFIEGASLLECLLQPGFTLEQKLSVVEKVALALHCAHKSHVVHRDVKPSNIMVRSHGEPVLMDFGLAKITEVRNPALTQSNQLIGTPVYMSPEQARGKKDIDYKSDIYSLGAVLYHCLAGHPPARGETLMEVLRFILSEPVVPPGEIVRGLPKTVENICMKALEKDRNDRYESAASMAEDLSRFRRGEATMADRYYKRRTFGRRWAIAMAIVFFLAMPLGWGFWKPISSGPDETDELSRHNAILAKFPREDKGYVDRALFFVRMGEIQSALQDISKAIELNPQTRYYELKGQWALETGYVEEAYRSLSTALQKGPVELRSRLAFAKSAENLHKYEEAYRVCQAIEGPHDDALKARLGRLAFHLKKYSLSLSHFESALSSSSLAKSERGEVLYYRGLIHRHHDRTEKALLDWEQALSLDPPQKRSIQYRLGKLYADRKEFKKAISCLQEAALAFPDEIEIQAALADACFQDQQYEWAIPVFTRCISLEPWEADHYCKRGICHNKVSEFGRAEEDFGIALKLDPLDLTSYVLLIDNIFQANFLENCHKLKLLLNASRSVLPGDASLDILFQEEIDKLRGDLWDHEKIGNSRVPNGWDEKKYRLLLKGLLESDSPGVHRLAREGLLSMHHDGNLYQKLAAHLPGLDGAAKGRLEETILHLSMKSLPVFRRSLFRFYVNKDEQSLKEMNRHGKMGLRCIERILIGADEESILRFWAAKALAELKSPEADRILAQQATSREPTVRLYSQVARAMGGIGEMDSRLFEHAHDLPNAYARGIAVRYIPSADRSFLRDPDLKVRLMAAYRLRMSDDPLVEETLIQGIKHGSPVVRFFSIAAYWAVDFKYMMPPFVKERGKKYLHYLLEASEDPDDRVRGISLLRMGMAQYEQAVAKIAENIHSKNPSIRLTAIIFLVNRGRTDLVMPILSNVQESFVSRAVLSMTLCRSFVRKSPTAALSLFNQLKNDPDPRIRLLTLSYLGIDRNSLVASHLLKQASTQKDEATKIGCILGMMAQRHSIFLPRLEELLHDESKEVRSFSAAAIVVITGVNNPGSMPSLYARFSKSPKETQLGAAMGYSWILHTNLETFPPGHRIEAGLDDLYRSCIDVVMQKVRALPWGPNADSQALSHKDYLDALSCAIQLEPKHAHIWFERGVLHALAAEKDGENQKKHYERSFQDVQEACRLSPDKFLFQRWMAYLYLQRGKELKKGVSLIDKLLQISPWDIELWQWKGSLLQEMGQRESADECFRRAGYLSNRASAEK